MQNAVRSVHIADNAPIIGYAPGDYAVFAAVEELLDGPGGEVSYNITDGILKKGLTKKLNSRQKALLEQLILANLSV